MAEQGFDARKKEEEARYKHRDELEFKVRTRRNKLIGQWAAGQMGLDGDAGAAYAKEVVISAIGVAGLDPVPGKIFDDLVAKGVEASQHQVNKELERLENVARSQINNE